MTTRTCRRLLAPVVILLLFVAACGGGGDDRAGSATSAPSAGTGPAPGATAPSTTALAVDPEQCPVKALETTSAPVDITFWHAMTERNEKTLQALADTYNSTQSKVRVKLAFQGTYNQTLDKYIAALRGGDLPSMVQMEETSMQIMLDSKSTVPIAACILADRYDTTDFAPQLFGQYTVGGQLVTMPFQLSNPVLFYNKAAFRRAGLDPEKPPTNLAELLAMARTIVSSGATPKAFSLQVQGWYPEQWTSMAGEALVDNDNGRTRRATKANLDGKAFGDAFAWIETMNKEGLIKNVGRDEKLTDALIAVALEEVAMTISTSAALGTIYDQLPLFPKIELGVAPLPGLDAGGVTVGGGSLYLMSKASDAQKAAVWDFMKFLSTPESQATWHAGTGYIPTRVSAASLPAVQALWGQRPGFKVAYDQLQGSKTPPGGGGPVIGDYVGFRNAIEAGIESILAGTPAAQAQKQAQAAATKAIQDYNKRIGG
jgi:sn-glycerol 3-phosphate transport system substrate-binding protein